MKKIVILLFISFFLFTNVYAQEQNSFVEKRYKWYKKEYKDIGFRQAISDTENYYQDLNNSKIEYSNYIKYYNQKLDYNYVIEDMYEYYKAKKVKYIIINHQILGDSNIRISELEIKDNNGNKIDYEVYECISCIENYMNYINDEIINTSNKSEILPDGVIKIKLFKEYDVDDININLYINSESNYEKYLHIYLCPTFDINYKTYSNIKYDYSEIISTNNIDDTLIKLKVDDNWENNLEYEFVDCYKEMDKNKISLTGYYKIQTYYRKVYKYYKTYKINKNYLDGYYSNVDNYIKDSNDYIMYYKYSYFNKNSIADNKLKSDTIKYENTLKNNNKINEEKEIIPLNNNSKKINDISNNTNNNKVYKYITKYKIKYRYKYINHITIISIFINIILIIILIYKMFKKKV